MKRSGFLALLCAAAIMLAGCGSSESSSQTADNNKPADSGSVSADQTTSQGNSDSVAYVRDPKYVETKDYPSLKELYKDQFLMGCAVSNRVMSTPEFSELVLEQFNSFTAENEMKPDAVLDRETAVSDPAAYKEHVPIKTASLKTCLDYCQNNGLKVRGHTLVWHSQTPEWFFSVDFDPKKGNVDRDTMLKRMENYIKDVLEWTESNYPGLIYAWDVVNEAASDSMGMRKESKWYETVGEDFVAKAFEYARKYAGKDVKLFYNDYNAYQVRKQNDIIKFLKPIAEAGNLDGVGMQSHIGLYLNAKTFMSAVKRYVKELGDIEIHITELDIGKDSSQNWEEKQKNLYCDFFKGLMELKAEGIRITSVTIWGLTDGMSWRMKERPLLFNQNLSCKPAFDGIVEAIKPAEADAAA